MVDCVVAEEAAVAVAVFRADLRRRSMKIRRKMARRMVMEMIEAMIMRMEFELRMALWVWKCWWDLELLWLWKWVLGGGGVLELLLTSMRIEVS